MRPVCGWTARLRIGFDQPDMIAKLPVNVAWCTECAACVTRTPQRWAMPTAHGTCVERERTARVCSFGEDV